MYKCKSINCEREFNEEEFGLTKDKNKCILHCNKEYMQKEELIRDSRLNFPPSNKRNEVKKFWEVYNREAKKENFLNKNIIFPLNNKIEFTEAGYLCSENDLIDIQNIKDRVITFYNCEFRDFFNFGFLKEAKRVEFKNCRFYSDCRFEKIHFKEDFIFQGCKIYGKTEVTFKQVIFEKNAVFINTKAEKIKNEETLFKLIFIYAEFNDNGLFNNTIIDYLLFENTFFRKETNFLNITLNSVANRETARIIKNSFEQQNNIIEANKFYGLEMKEREKELNWKKDFFDWIVFKAHGLTSNHSQDWFLASLWAVLFGMLLTVFKSDFSFGIKIFLCLIPFLYISMNKYMFIVFYSLYVLFMNSINKHPLDDFASNINPFSIMTSADKLTFIELVFKIIIAFLIYQLIVSIRQNTRRK